MIKREFRKIRVGGIPCFARLVEAGSLVGYQVIPTPNASFDCYIDKEYWFNLYQLFGQVLYIGGKPTYHDEIYLKTARGKVETIFGDYLSTRRLVEQRFKVTPKAHFKEEDFYRGSVYAGDLWLSATLIVKPNVPSFLFNSRGISFLVSLLSGNSFLNERQAIKLHILAQNELTGKVKHLDFPVQGLLKINLGYMTPEDFMETEFFNKTIGYTIQNQLLTTECG